MTRIQGEAGAGTLEHVLVTPLVLATILLVVQFGVYLHAAHVTEAAAHRGLRAAQADGHTTADGHAATDAFLDATGGLRHPRIQVARDRDQVTVTVTGAAPMVVPGLDLAVSSIAAGPVEQFLPGTRP